MKLLRFFAAVVCWSLAFQAFALPQNDAAQPKRIRIEPEVAAALLTHSVEPSTGPRTSSTVSTVTPVEGQQSRGGMLVAEVCSNSSGGEVLLGIVIDQQGKVIEAESIPHDKWPPNPALTEDPLLRVPAIKAVKQWEYKPYLLDGQPVEVETRVVVKFKPGLICRIIGGDPPPMPAVEQVLRVSAAVMEGNLLKHVDPVYPLISRNAPIRGEVRLLARVSRTGVVENLRGISGHPILIQSAMDAVRQWQYKPFLLNGEPVEAEGVVIVVFKR